MNIDPEREVPLGAGYYDSPDWQLLSPVEANMVALWIGGEPLVLIGLDALYVGATIRAAVEAALPSVPPQNIIVAASHTHSAPMLDPSKPELGIPDKRHTKMVATRISEALKTLMQPASRRPAYLRAGSRVADHSVNRRHLKRVTWSWPPKFNELKWQPNFWGKRDERVTVLEVVGSDGADIAIVWNYACHPVHFPVQRAVSSHFPGVVREILRERKPEIPVVFFQGFSGDTRPLAMAEARTPPTIRHLYRRLRWGTAWDMPGWTLSRYQAWANSLGSVVSGALNDAEPIAPTALATSRIEVTRTSFVCPSGPPVAFQGVELAPSFGVLAISAEVVAAYARNARQQVGTEYVMLVGCADDVVGYLPTAKMIRQGGYEGGQFLPNFELTSLEPDLQENVERGIQDAIAQLHSD